MYVSESGPAARRLKRLAIMDQDGHNHRFLTSGLDLVLTPRFSPTAHEIAYLNYFNDEPNVYLLDVASGRTERLGSFPGMTFAPRFGPDGNKLIMSLAEDGRTDIFEMDLRTQTITQLTQSASIDTSPSYSPDGNLIAVSYTHLRAHETLHYLVCRLLLEIFKHTAVRSPCRRFNQKALCQKPLT